jgi:hypothetical protein
MGYFKQKQIEMMEIPLDDQDEFIAFLFEKEVERVFTEGLMMLTKKHRDYGPKNISQSPGGPLNGLRVRMWDKFARINHLIDSGATPENESLRDSFLDLANYSMIALMVLDKTWPND